MKKNKITNNDVMDVFEQAIQDKTKIYEAARKKIEDQIDAIEASENLYDNGLGDIEDRLYLMTLRREIEDLDRTYKKEIEELTIQHR